MDTKRFRILLLAVLTFGFGFVVVAQVGVREFKPPRAAVVDISEIFEKYERKQATQEEFKKKKDVAERDYLRLKKDIERLEEDIKLVDPGSKEHKAQLLKKADLEFDLNNFQKNLAKDFMEQRTKTIRGLVDEITQEIERYARGHELDIVFEKKISAGDNGAPAAMDWPIIYFAKPEIDITQEIIKILNASYNKGGQPGAAPVTPAVPVKKK